jgi:hypothetical protein
VSASFWDLSKSVYVTSFWGWSPEDWGSVGFTHHKRRDTILTETPNPFIMVVYVTAGAPTDQKYLRGNLVGAYLVSHEEGHRDDHTYVGHHSRNANSWQYSLKALRAFSFLPEYQRKFRDVFPELRTQGRNIATNSRKLSREQVARLRSLPYEEVPVYGGHSPTVGEVVVPDRRRGRVRGGTINRTGYTVPGEPRDTEKELYVLRLEGNTPVYLGKKRTKDRIYKIGLSMSPHMRREAFQRALPHGKYNWTILRSTRGDDHPPYPSYEAALAGEEAMKLYLEENCDWRGGEFYAALPTQIDKAWKLGREAALAYQTPP